MARCPRCKKTYREPADEVGDHDCPQRAFYTSNTKGRQMRFYEVIGSDYYDSSNEHIALPETVDVEAERAKFKARRRSKHPHDINFIDWLLLYADGRYAVDEEVGSIEELA